MGLNVSPTIEEYRVKWEAETRAREARSEYGRTVGDLRRLLKGARQVQIAVRTGSSDDARDVHWPVISAAACRAMFKYFGADEFVACEFDPVEKKLCVGSLRAIRKAQESV